MMPARGKVLDKAEATRKLTYNNIPPMKLIEAIRIGYEPGTRGFEAERNSREGGHRADAEPRSSFFLKQKQEGRAMRPRVKPREVKHVAVIGGRTMGSGIVHVLNRAGYRSA